MSRLVSTVRPRRRPAGRLRRLVSTVRPRRRPAGRLRRLATGLAACAVLGAVAAPSASAQGQRGCVLQESRGLTRLGSVVFLQQPVMRCDGDTRIQADSAVIYTNRNFTRLYRNVFYQDSARILVADTAQYFSRAGRLQAQGDVRLTSTADSSTLTGQSLLYLRESEIRPQAQLTMTGGRPHAVLYPGGEEDSPGGDPEAAGQRPMGAGARPAPYEVDADRIFVEGESFFRATGNAEITREDLRAYGDRVEYDRRAGRMLIRPDGRIVSEGYELTGRQVLLSIPEDDLREVVATGDAALTGEELDLTAPEIRLYVGDGGMERLVAVRGQVGGEEEIPVRPPVPGEGGVAVEEAPAPESRPEAVAEEFILRADSLDVRLPDEILETVYAVGAARGESLSRDSLNTEETPELIRRDWLEGDTIVATFSPAPEDAAAGDSVVVARAPAAPPGDTLGVAPDSTPRREYRLERLVASGNARSLYRLAPSDSAEADTAAATPAEGDTTVAREGATDTAAAPPTPVERLAIHYVTGRRITIRMEEGEVAWMEVEGQTRGLHATPAGRRQRGQGGGAPPSGGSARAPGGGGP